MTKKHIYFTDRKRYYINQRARILYQERKIEERIIEELPTVKIKRIRQQVVFNSNYNISLRAIMINGDITEKELENILDNFLYGEENLSHIPFWSTGFETEEIDSDEDLGLKDGLIYIELNIKGDVTLINL